MCPALAPTTGQDRLDLGDLPAVVAQQRGVLELTALLLNAQIEALVLQVATTCPQLIVGQFLKFFDLLHSEFSNGSSSGSHQWRATKRVGIPSLFAASLMASLA